jgi:hypothetical protein
LVAFRSSTNWSLSSLSRHEDISLVRWFKRQRYQYKLLFEGKVSTKTQDRIAALESISFGWESQVAAWLDRLAELEEFRRAHNHYNVSCSYRENPQLGTLVKCQRRQFNLLNGGKPSSMAPLRIQKLNKLGF